MIGSSKRILGAAAVITALVAAESRPGADAALTLRVSGATLQAPVTIEVSRWSTDGERAPLRAAAAPAPAAPPAAAPPAGGQAAAGRGGRAAGRGGRGAAPPASPAVRLATAIKAAPTVGFIWGEGPTGFSIKYASRSPLPDGRERIVLVTDRRIPLAAPDAKAPPDAEFTVLEVRVDAKGAGEGRISHALPALVDTPPMLALDGYDAASAFKVTR